MKNFSAIARIALMSSALVLGSQSSFALSPAPTSWELAGEFNHTTNPGLVWSYGYKNPTFTILNNSSTLFAPNISGWQLTGAPLNLPLVAHNVHTVPWSTPAGPQQITFPPRGVLLHPGVNGEIAVVRFKAPTQGIYTISGRFYGMDSNGSQTQTAVSIVATQTNVPATIYAANISLPSQVGATFTSRVVQLNIGDTVDFQVAAGPGNNYVFGSTGIHAVIEKL